MRGQVRNQLHALQHNPAMVPQVCQRMEALDQTLTAQIAQIEAELATVLSSTQEEKPLHEDDDAHAREWAKAIARLQTVPGIGLITATWIVVTTMNFTLCADASKAVAYAGLAPLPRESGTSVHQRACIG